MKIFLYILITFSIFVYTHGRTSRSRSKTKKTQNTNFAATSSPYNQVNPNFVYPESNLVNFSQASIPYQGQAYSGYLNVNPETQSKIFYIVYPAGGAQNSEATLNNTAPLILWLQGGPGCADGIGNYQEIGPYTIVNQSGVLTPVLQEVSWNDEYNLLFVDSPAGTGYSVNDDETFTSGYQVSEYLQVFLIRFFEIYTSLAPNDFYIFGESYAGHYIPALATIIVQNISENGINLKGIGVGNGCTDPSPQLYSLPDVAFSLGLLDEYHRDGLNDTIEQGLKFIKKRNYDKGQNLIVRAQDLIYDINPQIYPYNFEQPKSLLDQTNPYIPWLKLDTTKLAYGVDPEVTYKDCVECEKDFITDYFISYAKNYTYLLSQTEVPDLKVSIYGGQNDLVCSNLGALNFIQKLTWSGISDFIDSRKIIFRDDNNNVIGNYKHYDRFTFIILYNAGHMVPSDQPANARLMLKYYMNDLFE